MYKCGDKKLKRIFNVYSSKRHTSKEEEEEGDLL